MLTDARVSIILDGSEAFPPVGVVSMVFGFGIDAVMGASASSSARALPLPLPILPLLVGGPTVRVCDTGSEMV